MIFNEFFETKAVYRIEVFWGVTWCRNANNKTLRSIVTIFNFKQYNKSFESSATLVSEPHISQKQYQFVIYSHWFP